MKHFYPTFTEEEIAEAWESNPDFDYNKAREAWWALMRAIYGDTAVDAELQSFGERLTLGK